MSHEYHPHGYDAATADVAAVAAAREDAGGAPRAASPVSRRASSPVPNVPAVCFAPNLSIAELRVLFGSAAVGLHTMWNEHFGIGVVELCAAGVAVGHGAASRDAALL